MIEIYRESIFALIERTEVGSQDDIMNLYGDAISKRATAATNLNETSSRSHCVFIITLTDPEGIQSQIYLIDLAGSERTKVSGAEGDRLAEANSINKSLSTLGLVLNRLLNKRTFIPYRDSKLTKVLAPVFTRTNPPSKVVMIANVSPSMTDLKETVSTLTFAQRVGTIEMKGDIDEQTLWEVSKKEDQVKQLNRSRSFC